MRAAICQHQLSGCPESLAHDIVHLSKFVFFPSDPQKNEDVRQTAIELVLLGHPAEKAIHHARAQAARDLRPAGYARLDFAKLHERIAAPEQEKMERWRAGVLDDGVEALLTILADGAASLADRVGRGGKKVSKRRAQQIVAELVARVEAGEDLISAAGALGIVRASSLQGGRNA